MKSTASQIDEYENYFRSHLENVARIPEDKFPRHYRKILFVSALDAMAKAVFPRSTNRARVVGVLQRFSGWTDGSRVSLPHLAALLAIVPDPRYEELRLHASSMLASWQRGHQIRLSQDPELSEIEHMWPREKDARAPIAGIDLEALQHWSLFYSYRNALVHEFQAPSIQMETPLDKTPSYIHFTPDPPSTLMATHWHLSYPEAHFKSVAEATLDAITVHLRKNNVDPVQFYVSGIYVLGELNVAHFA